MSWLKLWVSVLDDPDVIGLPDDTKGGWMMILAAAKRHNKDGFLPPLKTLAAMLHKIDQQPTVVRYLNELVEAGLIDEDGDGLRLHGWERWQERDKTTAERSARYRAKHPPLCTPPEKTKDKTRLEVTGVTRDERDERDAGVSVRSESLAPQMSTISRLAEELMGDVSWGIWADQQIKLGHPEHAIRRALQTCVDKGLSNRQFAGGVLQRLASEGYPIDAKNFTPKGNPRGPENQPAAPSEAELARIAAELAVAPKMTRAEYEERERQRATK
jgi:hypothetical protein